MLNKFKFCPICNNDLVSFSYETPSGTLRCKHTPYVDYSFFKNCHFGYGSDFEELYIKDYIIGFTFKELVIFKISDDRADYIECVRLKNSKMLYSDFLKINSDINIATHEFVQNYIIC